ncbi:uncharacterized protein VICG_00562 [Vittaforma corneae ATCC 50505]|uniref:Uncharacterized protein n=1 Tax=Vittaforma corneae (strain ATCC 50505) TaxID=993615 RepID=L2GNJ2_VITCO|nr:uncharacterized protein VICG_00562 [Vittaforma corneae ATCC 50505]ELA42463.1 hypothetical protein VICG_00562 [Vittaforma corneae ATCC 50505]
MKTLKSLTITVLKDMWGIIALFLLSLYLKDPGSNSSILDLVIPDRLIVKLKLWSQLKNGDCLLLLNIFFTYFFLSFFISICLTMFFFAFHLLYPCISKIVSSLLLPFAVHYFYSCHEWSDYKSFFLFASIMLCIYGVYKAYFNHDPMPYEMCNRFLDKFLQQSAGFYFSIFIQWILILVDVMLIRAQDLHAESIFDSCLLFFYLIAFIYTSSYSIRATLTIYHASRRLPAIKDASFFDKVYIFFNVRCFSFAKTLSFAFLILDSVYSTFFPHDPDIPSIFEYKRSSSFDCPMSRQSFFNYVLSSKTHIWKGDLRRKLRKVNLREDVLPSALISWMTLYTCIHFIQPEFIRIPESFVILFSHFFIVVEVFNSFIFIEIYRTTYGTIQEPAKSVPLNPIAEDDVVISKIDVNSNPSENVEM